MSKDLVAEASGHPAFDPVPLPSSLALCHVPFEQLIPGGEVEAQVERRLRNYERLGIVGPSGCGKSSLTRYAVQQGKAAIAPIWINVATEDREKVSTVRGFLEVLVAQLASAARAARSISDADRASLLARGSLREPLPRTTITTTAELGGSYWLLTGKVARQIARTVEPDAAYRATEDVRHAVSDVLAVIAGEDLVPVLVADDTDRLLRVPGDDDGRERLFAGFFGEVLREVSQLECGLAVAVHDEYRARAEYDGLTKGLLSHLNVPTVTSGGQVAQIIAVRLQYVRERAQVKELITQSGLERLAELHQGLHQRSLKATLADFHEGLRLAADRGADVVNDRDIDAAAAA